VGKIKNFASVHRKSTIENVILSAPLRFMEMKMIRLQRKQLSTPIQKAVDNSKL
jgi:hypothetical protein